MCTTGQATEFHFVRDYEVVKVEQEVPNEFLLVFDEGEPSSPSPSPSPGAFSSGETRRAGAYYKLIERKMLLKKKRTEVRCHWDVSPWALTLTPRLFFFSQ
jgi:RNA polymerase II-associated factor 1